MLSTVKDAHSVQDLISEDFLYNMQDEPEEVQEQIKTEILIKLDEWKTSSKIREQIMRCINSFGKATKQMEREYNKKNTPKTEIELAYNDKNKPLPVIENFLKILRNDNYFSGVKFNLLSYSPEIHNKDGTVEKWTDKHDSAARAYIECKYKLHNVQKTDDALRIFFAEREYHPIRDIINATKWDGKSRIETLLIKWLKCEDSPYSRELSRLIFAGGIHRLYEPGCKFDDVPVLIGTKQGEGKSTFARWLALQDAFFTEVTEMEGQRGVEALEGAWICEVVELLALTKSKEVEAVKSYIAKQYDKYRRPFDKRVSEIPRQCIFIGTTNKEQFLTDKTGNRRFYPLKVYSDGRDLYAHQSEVKADILQCWAEAKHFYNKSFMTPCADVKLLTDIKKRQSEALEDDYRVGMIEAYLETKMRTCVLDLWQNALHNEYTKPTRKDSNEIVAIMQNVKNWTKSDKPERDNRFGLQRFWYKVYPKRN